MSDDHLGRKILLSKCEAIVASHVYNNRNRIRYPLTFPGNRVLRGPNTRLDVRNVSYDDLLQGRYQFGANRLMVMRALDTVLDRLEDVSGGSIDFNLLEQDLEFDMSGECGGASTPSIIDMPVICEDLGNRKDSDFGEVRRRNDREGNREVIANCTK